MSLKLTCLNKSSPSKLPSRSLCSGYESRNVVAWSESTTGI